MSIPVSSIFFFSDAVIKATYPVYEELREVGPERLNFCIATQ